jgi:hypothetical protein
MIGGAVKLLRKPANRFGWASLGLTVASLAMLFLEPTVSGVLGSLAGIAGWAASTYSAADAEADRARLAALERGSSPRTVGDDTRSRLVNLLSQNPDGPIKISAISAPEPFEYARQLHAALVASGWDAGKVDAGPAGGAPVVGVFIRVSKANDEIPERARRLRHALSTVGIACRLVPSAALKANVVVLVVGVKPAEAAENSSAELGPSSV